jgi:hypothetical protein
VEVVEVEMISVVTVAQVEEGLVDIEILHLLNRLVVVIVQKALLIFQ